MRNPAVYIMASSRNGTLYTGVTSDLPRRVYQHRERILPGFTAKYRCHLLVFYEWYGDMPTAIAREKQIKGGSRRKKLMLIEAMNPAVARPLRRLRVIVIASEARQPSPVRPEAWVASSRRSSQGRTQVTNDDA